MNNKSAKDWAIRKLKDPDAMTDGGCTYAPDFTFKECCKKHDVMINYNQGIDNKQADGILKECITKAGYPKIAVIYWLFVRYTGTVGGSLNAVAIIVIPVIIGLLWKFG